MRMAFDHDAIDRADFVWKYDELVSRCYAREIQILDTVCGLAMRDLWRPRRQHMQIRRRPASGELFKRRAARKHQNYNSTHQVLAQQQRRNNRYCGKEVGAEFTVAQSG